jgi:pimeloyl-ACP methyl ester carboxylesterase
MRRSLLGSLSVLTVLAACGPKAAPTFSSERITVVTRGNGPDLILIPGLTSDRAVWDSVVGQLESRYRLHLIQVNGFAGLPPKANADGPVSAPVAEEIARYIGALDLRKPAVVGHSMGGTIAMMLAARHPDQVGKLMVLDMPPFPGELFAGPGITVDRMRPIADSMRKGMLAESKDSFLTQMGGMISGMTNKDALRPVLLGMVKASDQKVVANAFYELLITDLRPELANITMPFTVLYVIPPNTPPAQYEAALQQSFANAKQVRLVKVENSFHFIQLDQPGMLVAELDTLMTSK